MLSYWMCTGTEKLQSSPFHSTSCVYSGMSLPCFSIIILGFALQMPSTALEPRILPSHSHLVFLNVISLCIVSLFSLGLMAPFSLLYRCFFNKMDFLRFLWSAVAYFYSSPDVQVKPAAQAPQISPLQSSTLPQHYQS